MLRWYDIEVDLEGSANSGFSTGFIPAGASHNDRQRFGTNLSAKYNGPGGNTGNPALDALIILIKLRLMESLER